MAKSLNRVRQVVWALVFMTVAATVAAANQPPIANLISPPFETVFGVGDSIELRAQAFDAEGVVTKLEFYANGLLIGEDFLPPYSLWLSNTVAGTYNLHVVAVDDALARGTSTVGRVTVTALSPRHLDWAPATYIYSALEWNGTSVNWRSGGLPTVFHAGDSVSLGLSSPTLFIGIDGVPMPVAPAGTIIRGSGAIFGGDILTGGVTFDVGSRITVLNYTSSLSFPGGTLIQPSPGLTLDISGAPPGANFHFGTGPITNDSTTFTLQTGDTGVTFENDFVVRGNNRTTLAINPTLRPNASVRFSGTLFLGSDLSMQIYTDTAVARPFHQWTGSVVLRQDAQRLLRLGATGGGYPKGVIVSGNISDGPGDGTNVLILAGNSAPLRITGANTYSHGTRIESFSFLGVEVAPESSLGTGDVEAFGNLTLLGSRNLASNANLRLLGRAYLGRGVKIRLNSLTLGNTTYTNGLFCGTNIIYNNYLASNGCFRLPPVNLNPTVAITNPISGALLPGGSNIIVQASALDADSYISQVEFRLNGAPFAVRTNAPFQTTLREFPGGVYTLQAIAYDDDGGVASSSVVPITVLPRIDRIENLPTNLVVLEFDAPLFAAYAVQYSDLFPAHWTNIATFPIETSLRHVRYTNAVPGNLRSRFYRMIMP